MPQKKIKVIHTVKHCFVFLAYIWTTLSYSFVEACEQDQALGRPLSTWNWDLAFTPSARETSHLPPILQPYGRDRQTYLSLYQEYEASGFDFDLLKDRLQTATFETENYQALHAIVEKPTKIFPRKVSILCPTHRPHDLPLLLKNFHRQQGVECELILLPNGPDYDLRVTQTTIDEFLVEHPEHVGKIKIINVPPRKTLGDILNIGASHATHAIVGRMDADDLYGPNYFLNMFREGIHLTDAMLFGKSLIAFAFYDQSMSTLEERKALTMNTIPTRPGGAMHIATGPGGATHIAPKKVFSMFPHKPLIVREDENFRKDIQKKGGMVFSTTPFDICVLRSPNDNHTWRIQPKLKKNLVVIGDWSHIPDLL